MVDMEWIPNWWCGMLNFEGHLLAILLVQFGGYQSLTKNIIHCEEGEPLEKG